MIERKIQNEFLTLCEDTPDGERVLRKELIISEKVQSVDIIHSLYFKKRIFGKPLIIENLSIYPAICNDSICKEIKRYYPSHPDYNRLFNLLSSSK